MTNKHYYLIGLLISLILVTSTRLLSQEITQTVRGRVTDDQTLTPLAGATVFVPQDSTPIGTYTDDNGRFVLENVPVGRITLVVKYLGYEQRVLQNLVLSSGKELNLDIQLTESLMETEEIVVNAEEDRDPMAANNEFATVSARSFSVDETDRYAGSLGDPARMAANFAGVASAGDTRNDIVVRGNSPLGLLWRLEGIDIPNPNHFSTQGANGGPISMINNNSLRNSDFMTGAFPAEYGNANSGVFDLSMRTGNPSEYEHAFQIGFAGVELNTEGPINRETGATYLLTYRYSTLGFFDLVGISFGELQGVPEFQDGSFKVNLPLKNGGNLSFFGLGGFSNIDILESELEGEDWSDPEIEPTFSDIRQRAAMAVTGASYTQPIDEQSYLKTTLAFTGVWRDLDSDTLTLEQEPFWNFREQTAERNLQLALQYNRKINARHSFRLGGFAKSLGLEMEDSVRFFTTSDLQANLDTAAVTVPLHDLNERTLLTQLYGNWQWRINPRLSLNAGLHAMHLALNDDLAIEPRAGLEWRPLEKHSFSLGYGMHHQIQPLALYFVEDPDEPGSFPNQDLSFTRSQHLVGGYEIFPLTGVRIRLEGYYQWLDNVPVEDDPNGVFSSLNIGADFGRLPDQTNLVNEGQGRNYGVELTAEKTFSNNYYLLLTGSLFRSEYKTLNDTWNPTAFSTGYVANVLAGTEHNLGKRKRNQVFADINLTLSGGPRQMPVDLAASREANREIVDESDPWGTQLEDYFRLDVKIGFRQNFPKWSQEFAFNVQNVTNNDNLFLRNFNPRTGNFVERYQQGFFPVVQYKVRF